MGTHGTSSSALTIDRQRSEPATEPTRTTSPMARRAPVRPTVRSRPLRWIVELALVAVLYTAYDTTRGLRHSDLAVADRNGERILRWEKSLHLAPEHFLNQILWHVPTLAVLASYDYAALHFIVTPAVLVWIYRRFPEHYRSARTTLVVATVTALVIYWLLPTAPPRLLPGAPYHDILASVHQWGWWSSEGSAPRGLGGLTDQLAAMPSLHVGWALWSGWLIARHAKHRAVRVAGALYPVVTALVVMGTGNHYFFDTLAGVAVIGFGAAVNHLLRRPRSLARRVDAAVPDLTFPLTFPNRLAGRKVPVDAILVEAAFRGGPADGSVAYDADWRRAEFCDDPVTVNATAPADRPVRPHRPARPTSSPSSAAPGRCSLRRRTGHARRIAADPRALPG